MKRLALALLGLAAMLPAQTNTGTITGTVFDQSKAVVADVKITATNLATNVTQTASSNSDGIYSLPALEPGRYRLVLEKTGFNKAVREPIQVESSTTISLDFSLAVGNTSTEVTVTADAPLVQSASSTVQYRTDLKQIDELPVLNQSALQIVGLLPGVQGDAGVEQAAITTGFTTPGGGLSVSGSAMGSVQFQADGVGNTSMYYGRISLSFSTDAVAEVAVLQNSYSAEYRSGGGGIVSMTTKSGTNQIHGTVFSFSQNDILNAAPWQNSFRKKGMVRYWRGGTDFGGPVIIPKLYNGRNRTFFFFGFEPLRQYTQLASFDRVATPLERTGDFSQSVYNSATNQPVFLFQHFNPGTNTPIIPAAGAAYPIFPNATIPKSLISPIGQKILNLQQLPNMPINALGQNNSLFRHVRNTDNRFNIKFDQVITANNRLSFRISQAPTKGVRYFQGGLAEQVPTDKSTGTNAALSDTYTWGGNKVNEFRLGFNRSNIARTQTDEQLAINGYGQFGFPSFLTAGMPQISLGDSQVQSISSDPGSHEYDNFYELSDTISWTKGKHSLKFGFDIQAPQQNLIDYVNVGGSWGFNAAQTNVGTGSINTLPITGITGAQTGLGMASLLLGYPNSVSVAPAVIPYQYRWKYLAGFVQDDWKITPRLTLNLGLRYQIEVPRSEKHNMQGTFVDQRITLPSVTQQNGYVQLDGQNGAPTTLWPTRYNNIEPRFGFAYRLPKLIPGLQVLRGAYAISHVPTNGLYSSPFPDLSPRAASLATNGAANGGQVQMDFAPVVLPTGGFVMPPQGIITNFNTLNAIYRLARNVTIPYVQQWNMGLGFQFGKDYGLDVNYVGSKGTNNFGTSTIFNAVDLNQYVTQYQAGLNMSQLVNDPTGLLNANGTPVQVTRQNSLRPIPTLGDVTDPLSQGYGSRYNALQMNLTKRFSKGFQFGANYTWMKSMDDSSCAGQYCTNNIQNWGTGSPQIYGEPRSIDKSISVSDVPSTFRYNFNWDLPVGKGKPLANTHDSFLNQVIGNWKLSGNGEIRSGFPLQALSGTTAGFPDAVRNIRVNVMPGVDPVIPNWKDNCNNAVTQRCPYINVLAAFAPPAYLSIGNAARVMDYIRMPHIMTFNMAILKDFPIHEQVRLAFRAELYGALNHVYFQTNANNFTAYTGLTYSGTLVRGVTLPGVTANNVNTAYADIGANIGGNRTVQLGLKLYF